jgi:hypothetical protein
MSGESAEAPTALSPYDRIHAMRGDRVEAIWPIAARGRSA